MKIEITKHHGHYFLWIDDDCWMWDFETEVKAQQELADKARGDVLVVGYGLGIVQSMLMVIGGVTSVLTVEKFPEVLKENMRVFGKHYGRTVIGDFFDLDDRGFKYDTVIGDIWLDVTPGYLETWLAFRRKAQWLIKPGGQILTWGDECFKIWEEQLCPAA